MTPDDVRAGMIQAQPLEEVDDVAVGEFSGVHVIAPPGTKRARMALVANRIKPDFRALGLRGTWTFTWSGASPRKKC